MALILKDRVRETATVAGTGDAALLGAVSGFQSFSVVGNTNTCYYTISDQNGGDWEVGIGTYSTTGPTLARTTVLSSSIGGGKVTFTPGTKDVFLTYPAEKAVFEDASGNVTLPGDLTVTGSINSSTIDLTNIEVTNIKSKDGTQSIAIADSTGVATLSANPVFNAGTANGVVYLNGSKVATTGSALTFDGTVFTVTKPTAYNTRFAYDASNYTDIGYGGTNTVAPSNPFYYWNLNSSEQMRLTSTGLGIGTSSPDRKLSVYTTDATGKMALFSNGNTNTNLYLSSDPSSGGGVINVSNNAGSAALPLLFQMNGSEKMRLDSSGNLGLGVTPSANSLSKGIDLVGGAGLFGYANQTELTTNAYFDSAWKYKSNGYACVYETVLGQHIWQTAPSGTAGNAISFTQAMTLDASGNLGIGTSSPSQPLQLTKTQNASTWAYVTNGSNGSGAATGLLFGTDQGTSGAISQNSSGNSDVAVNALRIRNLLNAPISFEINSSAKALLDASGNLGLGVTPSAWVDDKAVQLPQGSISSGYEYGISTTSNAYRSSTNVWKYTSGQAAFRANINNIGFQWYTAPSGTAGNAISFTQAMTLDDGGNLSVGTTSLASSGQVNGVTAGTVFATKGALTSHTTSTGIFEFQPGNNTTSIRSYGATAGTGAIAFNTGGGGGSADSERMRIDSSGNVQVSNLAGTGNRAVYSTSTGVLTNSSSDRLLKENDAPISQGLDAVLAMRPISYEWIDKDKMGAQREIGFIAQEMQQIVPEVVGSNSDETLSIDYPKLVAVMAKAIQELTARVVELEAK